jgi:hypothetical protein
MAANSTLDYTIPQTALNRAESTEFFARKYLKNFKPSINKKPAGIDKPGRFDMDKSGTGPLYSSTRPSRKARMTASVRLFTCNF